MVIDIHQHFYERSLSNLDSGFARFLFFCYSSGDFFDSSEPRGRAKCSTTSYLYFAGVQQRKKKKFLGRIYRRGSRPCILSPLTPLFLFDARGIGNVIQYAGMLQSSRISVRNPTDCPMTSISNENSVLHNRFSCVRCCVLRQVLPCFSLALRSAYRYLEVRVVTKLIDKLIGLGPVYYRTLNRPSLPLTCPSF